MTRKRNRRKQIVSFDERLRQAARDAHEAAMRCGDDGVQLHGGAGFMRDYAVEKLMRDAKQIGLEGAARDIMLQKARQAETALRINGWLASPH